MATVTLTSVGWNYARLVSMVDNTPFPALYWNAIRTGSLPSVQAGYTGESNPFAEISRATLQIIINRFFLVFDIASLPASIQIDSVNLRIYGLGYGVFYPMEFVVAPAYNITMQGSIDFGGLVGLPPYDYIQKIIVTQAKANIRQWYTLNLNKALPPSFFFPGTGTYIGYSIQDYAFDYSNNTPSQSDYTHFEVLMDISTYFPQLVIEYTTITPPDPLTVVKNKVFFIS